MQPKVLFIAHVENHLLNFHQPFFNYFQSTGWQVHVATSTGKRREELVRLGVVCHDVDFARSPFSLANIKAFRQLRQIMRREKFSLVHVHTPVGAFLGRLAARLTATKPVVYTVHGFHFYQGSPARNWLLYYPLESLAARWTDELVVINREDYELAKRLPLRVKGAVSLLGGVGLDLNLYSCHENGVRLKARSSLGFKADDLLMLFVGEFMAGKNHLQSFLMLRELAAEQENIFLLLAGEGEYEQQLRALVKNLGITERVRFLGFRRDIPGLLCACDIFLLTSLREGLPRAVMEAMAAGKPVVATDIRGNRDLIADGENGFLVRTHDVGETVQAVRKLAADEQLRARMGRAGLEMVKVYALEQVLAEMEQVYARAFERCGGDFQRRGRR
ncbi:MAG: putative glycosyltransferase EpsD [Firmicutes bacterium]|nr:putative glycosyltransferase EpsD [Bacillota bacterium]